MAWQALQCLNAFRLRPCQASLINLVGMIKSTHPKNCFREQFEEVSPTDKKRPTTPAPTHENLEDQRLKKSFKLKNLGNFNSRYSRNSITSFDYFRPVEEFYLLDESKVWSRIGKKYWGLAQTEKQTSI